MAESTPVWACTIPSDPADFTSDPMRSNDEDAHLLLRLATIPADGDVEVRMLTWNDLRKEWRDNDVLVPVQHARHWRFGTAMLANLTHQLVAGENTRLTALAEISTSAYVYLCGDVAPVRGRITGRNPPIVVANGDEQQLDVSTVLVTHAMPWSELSPLDRRSLLEANRLLWAQLHPGIEMTEVAPPVAVIAPQAPLAPLPPKALPAAPVGGPAKVPAPVAPKAVVPKVVPVAAPGKYVQRINPLFIAPINAPPVVHQQQPYIHQVHAPAGGLVTGSRTAVKYMATASGITYERVGIALSPNLILFEGDQNPTTWPPAPADAQILTVQVLQLDAGIPRQTSAADMAPCVRSVVTWRTYFEREDVQMALDSLESFLRHRLMTGTVTQRRQVAWDALWMWVKAAFSFDYDSWAEDPNNSFLQQGELLLLALRGTNWDDVDSRKPTHTGGAAIVARVQARQNGLDAFETEAQKQREKSGADRPGGKGPRARAGARTRKCYTCGAIDHIAANCSKGPGGPPKPPPKNGKGGPSDPRAPIT